jgi:hypothetical protein
MFMPDDNSLSSDNNTISAKQVVEGFSGWAKTLGIIYFIFGAFSMLGIVTIPIGVFMILAGMNLLKGAEASNNILDNSKDTKIDQNIADLIVSYKSHNKNIVITYIINLVLTIIIVIISFLLFVPFFAGISSLVESNSNVFSPKIEENSMIESLEYFQIDETESL